MKQFPVLPAALKTPSTVPLHSIGTPESLKVRMGVNDESPEGQTEEIENGKKLQ